MLEILHFLQLIRRMRVLKRVLVLCFALALLSIAAGLLLQAFGTPRPNKTQFSYRLRETIVSKFAARGTGDGFVDGLPQASALPEKCLSPRLPLYTQLIRDNRPTQIPADVCSKQNDSANWLRVWRSRVYLKPGFESANCTAEPVVRVDDQSSRFARTQPLRNGSRLPSLGFRANCRTRDGRRHRSIYYGINEIQPPEMETKAAKSSAGSPERDNIIILGMDSISRLESLRSLPNVSSMVQSELGGVTLLQYNIMGDGTPAALLPILTGLRESEMPEARKGFKGARCLDEAMRWIFQDLRELGYLSLYGEEGSEIGTFQLRFLGFKKEPADFYLRPTLQQQEAVQTKRICIGDEVSSARMLDRLRELFLMYPRQPKFAFLFLVLLSHENQDLSLMDSELAKFVRWFASNNLAENTSLVFMSDHGQRHGPLRNSMQGKLEESLPVMTLALSRRLRKRLTNAQATLERNINRLTSPLDVHKTLLSLAGISQRNSSRRGGNHTAYSLIDQEVPENRTCLQAGIPTHWCSCLSRVKLERPESRRLAAMAAAYAVGQINRATQPLRRLCQPLTLQSISEADVSLASTDLAQRHRSVKNFFAVNSANAKLKASGYVTVRLTTKPNDGVFEATLQFIVTRPAKQSSRLEFAPMGEASRINRYGSQARCITQRALHLRKFCFCRQD